MAAKYSVITCSVGKLGGRGPLAELREWPLISGQIYKETRWGEQTMAADQGWPLISGGC